MRKKIDSDILIIKQVSNILMKSSNRYMLWSNLQYINNRFIVSPAPVVMRKFHKDLLVKREIKRVNLQGGCRNG